MPKAPTDSLERRSSRDQTLRDAPTSAKSSRSSPKHVFINESSLQLPIPMTEQSAAGSSVSVTRPARESETMIQARGQGLNRNQVAAEHFPNITTNACRKIPERLMERQNPEQRDGVTLEVQKEMWGVLAARGGAKWTPIEQKFMDKRFRQTTRKSAKDRIKIDLPTRSTVASNSESKTNLPCLTTGDVPSISPPQQGLPPLLSPVQEPPGNPYGLPELLSPTLPSNIKSELDKLDVQRKRAESNLPTASPTLSSNIQTEPDKMDMQRKQVESNVPTSPSDRKSQSLAVPGTTSQKPAMKSFEDRHLQHFDRSNSNASGVPDTLKERLKYTISKDDTTDDAARHKLRFMALGRTSAAGASRHIP